MPCCASAKAISVHSPPCRLFKFSMAFAERRGGLGGGVTVSNCSGMQSELQTEAFGKSFLSY